MISFRLKEPVFKTQPVFILGCSAKQAEKFLKKRYKITVSIDRGSTCGTMITRAQFPYRIVWCKSLPSAPGRIGVMLHELFHLVTRICGDKGVPIHHHIETGECGDEAAAYLYEFFAVRCLRKVRKKRAK